MDDGDARRGAAQPGDAPQPVAQPVARRDVDTAALQGLAHPLRVRIFDELVAHGPANSTELARRFGESSGATSYHLRQLARHGFIQELERGSTRERWWRAAPESMRLDGDAMQRQGSAATRQAAQLVLGEWRRGRNERVAHWVATSTSWPQEWVDASLDATAHLRLRVDELQQLRDELQDVITRWADAVRHRRDEARADDEYDVELQVNAFPLEPPRDHDGLTSRPAGRDPYLPAPEPPTPLPPMPPLPPGTPTPERPAPFRPGTPHPPGPPEPPRPPSPPTVPPTIA